MAIRNSPGCNCCGSCCSEQCSPSSSHHEEYEFTFSALSCTDFTGSFNSRKKVSYLENNTFPSERQTTQGLNCTPTLSGTEKMFYLGCKDSLTLYPDGSWVDEDWPYYPTNPCKAMSGDFIVNGCTTAPTDDEFSPPSPSSDDFPYDAPANAVSYCFWNFSEITYYPRRVDRGFGEDAETIAVTPRPYSRAGYFLDNPDTSQIRIEDTICSLKFDYTFYGFDFYKFKISNGGSVSYEWRLYVKFDCELHCCCAAGVGTNAKINYQTHTLKEKTVFELQEPYVDPVTTPYTNTDWYWSYVPDDGTCNLDGTESWTETRPTLDLSVSCNGKTFPSFSPFRPSVDYTVSETLDDWGYLCENMGIGQYTLTSKPKAKTS